MLPGALPAMSGRLCSQSTSERQSPPSPPSLPTPCLPGKEQENSLLFAPLQTMRSSWSHSYYQEVLSVLNDRLGGRQGIYS